MVCAKIFVLGYPVAAGTGRVLGIDEEFDSTDV